MKKWLKTILSLAMILVAVITSSTVFAENTLNTQIKNALSAIGNPAGITEIYHYHYSGKETLANQAGLGLGDAFGIEEATIPDTGHLFLIYCGEDIGCVLEDEAGNILESLGMLSMNTQPASVESAQQLLNATTYGVCTLLCRTSEDADVNTWHKLTQAQIENLTNKDQKEGAQATTFVAKGMDIAGSDLSANALREKEFLCSFAAVIMCQDLNDTLSRDEFDAIVSSEIWVATIDNAIYFNFFARDGLHLVTYIPNQPAKHAYMPDSTDSMRLFLTDNDTLGLYDSVHHCTKNEISVTLDAIENALK